MTEERKFFRVIVCGGRDFRDADAVSGVLDAVLAKHPDLVVVQGGADGADRLAFDWAKAHGVPVSTFPANWEQLGRRAGPVRNATMLRVGAAGVVAFPGGRGTADMVRQAEAAGVPVWKPLGGKA